MVFTIMSSIAYRFRAQLRILRRSSRSLYSISLGVVWAISHCTSLQHSYATNKFNQADRCVSLSYASYVCKLHFDLRSSRVYFYSLYLASLTVVRSLLFLSLPSVLLSLNRLWFVERNHRPSEKEYN